MAVSQAQPPTSAEVEAHLRRLQARHPEWVRVRTVARTAEARALLAVTVTDRAVPARDKQHVLITGGHHGSEESGRLIALALLDWLVTPSAAETRAKQQIVVLPNMCPDAAERNFYVLEGAVSPMRDHWTGQPVTAEGKAFEEIAYRLAPEVYVDLHARGLSGCSYDMVLWSEPGTYLEDDYLLHRIAAEMGAAGEKAGLPNIVHPLSWPGFMSENPDVSSASAFVYRQFKALSFLTETAESDPYSHPARLRARSGLARLRALLAWGNRRYPKLYYPGYPCSLVGLFPRGMVAVGKTAAARRASRLDLWRNREGFTQFAVAAPEGPEQQALTVVYEGPTLPHGVGFQTAVRGRREITGVVRDGKRLRPSETNGYLTWTAGAATYVVVAQPELRAGRCELRLDHRAG